MNDNNNLDNNMIPVPEVIMIPDHELEEINLTTLDKEINNSNNNSNNNNNNSNKSTILLILLFIFLFSFVFMMPYIRNYIEDMKIDKGLSEIEKEAIEEEKRQQQEENKNNSTSTNTSEPLLELTCISKTFEEVNYTLIKTQKFYYNKNNQIISSSLLSNYTFNVVDDTFQTLKTECDQNSLKYINHDGFTMACSYNDTNIDINYEFDLDIFTPILDNTNIEANASYKQDINTLKDSLISSGYVCN